jgi:hypothetical protein
MSRNGKSGRRSELRRVGHARPLKSVPLNGREILRFEEHLRIAPKHPGMGRR